MASSARITFPNGRGEDLAGRLELPDEPRAFCVFAHCFTCSKDTAAASRISRGLAQRGFGVLRFDFTGLGGSDGDFANENFSSNQEDLVAAAAWLRENHAAPTLLVGHSLGGAAVLATAHRIPEVKAVATIGAPSAPSHVEHLLAPALTEIERDGEATVQLAGRDFRVRRQFLEDLRDQPFDTALRDMHAAVLLMHAPDDEVVALDHARQLFLRLSHPRSFLALDGADHLLTRPGDARRVADLLASWASAYAPEADEVSRDEALGVAADLPEGEVIVREQNGAQGLTQDVFVGRAQRTPHRLTGDEPERLGGADEGPTPYGYLLTSLGTCTSMTLRMYARHKKWPLENVEVRLRHEKVDDPSNAGGKHKVDRIERVLKLEGPLDEEQRSRLLEIADRCPVHRTLTGDKRIETRLDE
jgi:uncharacterized OsmC-like protein/alpha/beta superfamily hydrolase